MTRKEGRGKKLLKKIQNTLSREVTKKKYLSRSMATYSKITKRKTKTGLAYLI